MHRMRQWKLTKKCLKVTITQFGELRDSQAQIERDRGARESEKGDGILCYFLIDSLVL